MNLEKECMELVQKKNPKKNIIGLRGLVKTGEEEYTFSFTFQDGNYLSLSEPQVAQLKKGKLALARNKTINKTIKEKNKITQ